MTRSQIKQMARAQLGNQIFGNVWLFAVLVIVVQAALTYLINVVPVVGQVAALLVMGPLSYGVAKLFLKQTRMGGKMDIIEIFDGFKDDFSNTFLIMLMTQVFTFLWSLLFIIPGIVKGLGYSMAMYIKADNPEYDWRFCLDESERMMRGHKGEYFVLLLSFIGWEIVGALCFGVGTLWVTAYVEATKAQFYENLRLTENGRNAFQGQPNPQDPQF